MESYEEEENEKWLPDFCDVEDLELRSFNRGAILANLFEDYYDSLSTASHSYKELLEEMQMYLDIFPKEEQEKAKDAMNHHLKQRGFVYGS